MLKQILFFALAVAGVSANLEFTNCGSPSQVTAFRLRGCTQVPCTFQRGGEYYGELDAIPAVATPRMPYVVTAHPGFPLPAITIIEGEACEDLIYGTCPTQVGQPLGARLYINVPTLIPTFNNIMVRLVVRDALNQVQVCIEIRVNIV